MTTVGGHCGCTCRTGAPLREPARDTETAHWRAPRRAGCGLPPRITATFAGDAPPVAVSTGQSAAGGELVERAVAGSGCGAGTGVSLSTVCGTRPTPPLGVAQSSAGPSGGTTNAYTGCVTRTRARGGSPRKPRSHSDTVTAPAATKETRPVSALLRAAIRARRCAAGATVPVSRLRGTHRPAWIRGTARSQTRRPRRRTR